MYKNPSRAPSPLQTICYSRLPTSRNEDGLVALQFNKPNAQLLTMQDAITKSLKDAITKGLQDAITKSLQIVNPSNVQAMMDNISVQVDSIRPLPDNW